MRQRWINKRTRGKGASYYNGGVPVTDKQELEYYKSLKIPPAWRGVHIAASRNAKILAVGTDKAGRKQYIYHSKFRAQQEQAKFERILRFARVLPGMRRQVEQDLARPELDYQKVMAAIVSLMDRTHIRVGNDTCARQNQSYGLTTLRSKHTDVQGITITFEFTGKSGQQHAKQIHDRTLARIVRKLDELPGYEIFKYYDADGDLRDVKSSDVNAYIKEVMGEEFSAKDFRTWAGTVTAYQELTALAEDCAEDEQIDVAPADQHQSIKTLERERKKQVTACIKKVAGKLGNTPAVTRSSYIDPRIIEKYMNEGRLHSSSALYDAIGRQEYLSEVEQRTLELLQGSNPAV